MDVEKDEEERMLYGFGGNTFGELGLGDAFTRRHPTASEFCRGKDIVRVTAGNEQTAVLTRTGEVYCCGYNFEGQCGIGDIDGVIPEKIPSFTKVALGEASSFRGSGGGRASLVHLSNGCEHFLVVTEGGELQTCGCNAMGQLGHGNVSRGYASPTPVAHLFGYKVAKVACSYNHTVAVTDDNRTWTFGGNDYGQLGHGDKAARTTPTPLALLHGVGVLSVACGLYHTVIAVAGGGILGFGKNDEGQLGLEGGEPRYLPARHKGGTGVVIKQLACGYFHTVALSASGDVFAFGRNDYGQLGLGHRESTWQASRVPDLIGKKIVQVACGSYHTVSLDAEGRVYPFGRNNHGQLGTGTTEDSCRPCFVEKLSEKFVCQVAAGFYHTLCLTGPPADGAGGAESRVSRSLSSDMHRLLGNPLRSDVTFCVEGREIYGHRCIIGARCEPLERMLDGPMKEAFSDGGSIPLPNHRYVVFSAFLEFLYTDKVMELGADLMDLEFCLDLLDVADQYLVEALKRLCENAIFKNITAENVCELLLAADARQAIFLKERCLGFIAKHKGLVVSSSSSSSRGYDSLPAGLQREVGAALSDAAEKNKQLVQSDANALRNLSTTPSSGAWPPPQPPS